MRIFGEKISHFRLSETVELFKEGFDHGADVTRAIPGNELLDALLQKPLRRFDLRSALFAALCRGLFQIINVVQINVVEPPHPRLDIARQGQIHYYYGPIAAWFEKIFEARCGNDRLRAAGDRKSTRLNSSHGYNSYAVF